jgi:hypothetical protein
MSRATRFQPDPLDHALIDFNKDGAFNATAVALIMNESYTGCSLLIKTTNIPQKDQILKVKVGRLDVMPGRVVWVKAVEDGVIKVGIQFLE